MKVISAEFEAIGQGYLPVRDYVDYYRETAADSVGSVAKMLKSLAFIDRKGRGKGLSRMFEEAA